MHPLYADEPFEDPSNTDNLKVMTLQQPLTEEEKLNSLNEFFEGLFNSLDYSLLFIFLGNLCCTIPHD